MRRVLSVILCVFALAGLTLSAASSSSANSPASPTPVGEGVKPDINWAVSNGPQDTTCSFYGIRSVCEYGVSSVRQPNDVYNYFLVHAGDNVIWHSPCGPCGWYAVNGATAHSGVAAIAYSTGVLTMFRKAGTQEAFFCRWYSSVDRVWAAARSCG